MHGRAVHPELDIASDVEARPAQTPAGLVQAHAFGR